MVLLSNERYITAIFNLNAPNLYQAQAENGFVIHNSSLNLKQEKYSNKGNDK